MASQEQNQSVVRNFPLDDYARHVQRTALVDSVDAAMAFCFTSITEEKLDVPAIEIQPVMTYDDHTDDDAEVTSIPKGRVRFQVTIAGHTS